jgi:hypothetical protein
VEPVLGLVFASEGYFGRCKLIRLTSGQFWGFWGTSFARNAGGFDPVSKVPLGMDAFGCRKGKCQEENGVAGDEHGERHS